LDSTTVPPAGVEDFRVATGRSSSVHVAIAADNTIVVATADGQLTACSASGQEQWRTAVNAVGFVRAPSIAANGTIFALGYNSTLYAVSATGAPLWNQTLSAFGAGLAIGGDGTLYVALSDRLEARAPTNGALLWTASPPGAAGATYSPAIGPTGDILVPGYGALTAVRPDGTVRWSTPLGGGSQVHEPALSADGATVYVTADAPSELVALDAATGTIRWSRTYAGAESATAPAVGPKGTIYVASNDDELIAFAPDGTPQWSYTALPQGSGENPTGAAAVADNGTIALTTSDGMLHLISPFGGLLSRRRVLGVPFGAVVIDRRGAAIVTSRCELGSSACGMMAVFTGGRGPAASWSKLQGALDNSGRR
jgi:outer membrane protein assembly factor BamB